MGEGDGNEKQADKTLITTHSEEVADEQLLYWWSLADLETRRSFVNWIIEYRP